MISREPADLTGLQQAFPYPRSVPGATTDLSRLILAGIEKNGPISFRNYMAQCLYHPDLGYYARADAPTVSKKGDFMTSVSVGPLFGHLLAARLHRFWLANGSPSSFTILEVGAHDGSLASDILSASKKIDPTYATNISYFISEPLPARQKILQARLQSRATVVNSPSEVKADLGALVANEVLDALPVPLLLFTGRQWHEACVTAENDVLQWHTRLIESDLPKTFSDGYVTEGSPDLSAFLTSFSGVFERGLHLWIDYGLDEESLYHPARTAGTLRCFRNHRSDAHPLDFAGEQDLTADVNFTAVENSATQLGFQIHPVLNQSRYLTHCAREWLLGTPSAKEISQFQTLTHPSQFGNRFYALELTIGKVELAFP
jgi:SAM-dependent MidA family methyltransferase